MQNGEVTDATRIEGDGADHHRDRRQRRQGDPALAFRPPERARCQGLRSSRSPPPPRASSAGRSPLPRTASARSPSGRRRHEARRHSLPGEHPLPRRRREERSRFRRRAGARSATFIVNDAFSVAHRANASTEGLAHKLPAYAGRAMQAELEALAKALRDAAASGRRDRRRRQDFDQARTPRQPPEQGRDADHRRRHGQHLPGGAGQAGRQVAVRARPHPDRARHSGQGQSGRAARSCCRSMRSSREQLAAHAPSRVVAVDAVGADDMILDIGPRTVEHVISVLARVEDAGLERPVRRLRSANRSTTAPSRSPKPPRNSPTPASLSALPAAATRSRRSTPPASPRA